MRTPSTASLPTHRAILTSIGALALSGASLITASPALIALAATAPTGTVVGSDSFTRKVTTGWGSAAVGGAYTTTLDNASSSVNGSAGLMAIARNGGSAAALLNGIRVRDVDVTFRISNNKLTSGGDQSLIIIGRRVSATDDYRARLYLGANGAVSIDLARMVSSTVTQIVKPVLISGLTFKINTPISVHFSATGAAPTTLRARAWLSSAAEPAAWTVTASDGTATLATAGAAGLATRTPAGTGNAVTFTTDDLVVRD